MMKIDGVLVVGEQVFREFDGAIIGNLIIIDLQNDIVLREKTPRGGIFEHLNDKYAVLIFSEAICSFSSWAVQSLSSEAEIGEAVAIAVFTILQHVTNNARRYEVSKVFSAAPAISLHDDPNDLFINDNWPTAIPRIDGCVNLSRQ